MLGVAEAVNSEPVTVRPAADTQYQKARAAIDRAKSVDELQGIRARIVAAVGSGRITPAEAEDLHIELGEREAFFIEGGE
jgi:hypothetical protein